MSIELLREIVAQRKAREAEEIFYDGYYEDNFSEWYEVEEGQKCQACYGTGMDRDYDTDCLSCYGEGYV